MIYVFEIEKYEDPFNILKLSIGKREEISRDIISSINNWGFSELWIHRSDHRWLCRFIIDDEAYIKCERSNHYIKSLLRIIKIDQIQNGIS